MATEEDTASALTKQLDRIEADHKSHPEMIKPFVDTLVQSCVLRASKKEELDRFKPVPGESEEDKATRMRKEAQILLIYWARRSRENAEHLFKNEYLLQANDNLYLPEDDDDFLAVENLIRFYGLLVRNKLFPPNTHLMTKSVQEFQGYVKEEESTADEQMKKKWEELDAIIEDSYLKYAPDPDFDITVVPEPLDEKGEVSVGGVFSWAFFAMLGSLIFKGVHAAKKATSPEYRKDALMAVNGALDFLNQLLSFVPTTSE